LIFLRKVDCFSITRNDHEIKAREVNMFLAEGPDWNLLEILKKKVFVISRTMAVIICLFVCLFFMMIVHRA
jgi:hypothetical protein